MMRGVYCDGALVRLRRDLPAPEPGAGDVVLKVRAAGICETDLQLGAVTWDSKGCSATSSSAKRPTDAG